MPCGDELTCLPLLVPSRRYQGLAASGGDYPLPRLRRLALPSGVKTNADRLATLLLPSVRAFISDCPNSQVALLTANALRGVGYKHTWELRGADSDKRDELYTIIRAIAPCTVADGGVGLPSLDDLVLGSLFLGES
jgi:hypothetical protein